jgi:cysteine dioxygenase
MSILFQNGTKNEGFLLNSFQVLSKTDHIIKNSNHLPNLVDLLSDGDFESAEDLLKSTSFNPDEFLEFATWAPDKYTRNCIASNDHFELILLCWPPGQGTQIHNHDNKNCLVKVISGNLLEKTYQLQEESFIPTGSSILLSGEVTQATAEAENFLHSLKNYTPQRAMSLHLYMEPIKQCLVFDSEESCFKQVEVTYDTEAAHVAS